MTNRLVALVVALVVGSAPVALEVCQITCESGMESSMSHAAERHAAHQHLPASRAACHEHGEAPQQMCPLDGPCDHGAEATPSLLAARSFDTAVSLVAALPSIDTISLVPRGNFVSVGQAASSDRLEIPLAIPLRV
jgi:hypothetical protein